MSPQSRGTDVRLKITPSMTTPGGRVVLNENDSLPLTKPTAFSANFAVKDKGFYKIELIGPAAKVAASPQLHDRRPRRSGAVCSLPTSRDATPTRRRSKKSSPRCGPTTTTASNGSTCSTPSAAERKEPFVHLFGGAKSLPEVTASHTIYLEELGAEAGRFVSLLREGGR